MPLFDAWSQCVQTEFTRTCMDNVTKNRSFWESLISNPESNASIAKLMKQKRIDEIGDDSTPFPMGPMKLGRKKSIGSLGIGKGKRTTLPALPMGSDENYEVEKESATTPPTNTSPPAPVSKRPNPIVESVKELSLGGGGEKGSGVVNYGSIGRKSGKRMAEKLSKEFSKGSSES